MKKQLLITIGIVGLLTIGAQATQEQLAASIRDARLEATRTLDQLKLTLDTLTAVTKQKEGDLRPAYNAFAAEVPKTEAAAGWTRTRVEWMASDGEKYFASWQKTIDSVANESLRGKAQKRLNAARKSYDKIAVALRGAAEKFQPFLSDLADIQKILSNDVTRNGVKAVKGTVNDANWRYNGVRGSVNDALKELQKMEKTLSPEAK
jgi:hypothetical protein